MSLPTQSEAVLPNLGFLSEQSRLIRSDLSDKTKGSIHSRALLKTVSWRGLALLTTTAIVFGATGKITFAASVGLAELLVKSGAYYLHECLWDWLSLSIRSRSPIALTSQEED